MKNYGKYAFFSSNIMKNILERDIPEKIMALLTPNIKEDVFNIKNNLENIPPFCSPSFLTI